MLRSVKLSLLVVLVFASPYAVGQSTLGALLDGGAHKLTVEEFKAELMQRSLVGPTAIGLELEVMYTSSGTITGVSILPGSPRGGPGNLDGEWRTDSEGRICSSMRLNRVTATVLAPRCQFWFKLGDTYYLSDSDSDRYAKILPRKLK